MILKHQQNQNGFIALISVIVIFAILLVLASLIAFSSFFTRFNVLDFENKKVSVSLAEACAESALVNLAKDQTYSPSNLCVSVNGTDTCGGAANTKTCKICSITVVSPNNFSIVTRAAYNKTYTNLTVAANLGASNFTITSWDETLTTPPSCPVP